MRLSIHGLFFRKHGKNLEPDSPLDVPLKINVVQEALKCAGVDGARIEVTCSEIKDEKDRYAPFVEIIPSTEESDERIAALVSCLRERSVDVELRAPMKYYPKKR
jgi:hypothetical protein